MKQVEVGKRSGSRDNASSNRPTIPTSISRQLTSRSSWILARKHMDTQMDGKQKFSSIGGNFCNSWIRSNLGAETHGHPNGWQTKIQLHRRQLSLVLEPGQITISLWQPRLHFTYTWPWNSLESENVLDQEIARVLTDRRFRLPYLDN